MSEIRDVSDGIEPAQYFDRPPGDPIERRYLCYKARVAKDPTTGVYRTIPGTVGYAAGEVLWRTTWDAATEGGSKWQHATPATVRAPLLPGNPKDPPPTVSGPLVLPTLQQAVLPTPSPRGDTAPWAPDVGLEPERVATAFGEAYAGGTPGLAVSGTTLDQQALAWIPAGGILCSVWRGGHTPPLRPWGRFGSRVYDVTPDGSLDPKRWARLHATTRVYLRPSTGKVSFGGSPTIAPGGLAWELGIDVEGGSGLGIVADLGGASGAPTPKKSTTGSGQTVSANGTPSSSPAADPLAGLPFGSTVGPDGSVNLPPPAQGMAPGIFNPGLQPGPLVDVPRTTSRATGVPATTSAPGGGSTRVLAASTYTARGPLRVGATADVHQLGVTPDGEPINSLHLDEGTLWAGPTGDAPIRFDPKEWERVVPDGPFFLRTYLRTDPKRPHEWLGEEKPTLRDFQTSGYIAEVPMIPTEDGPGNPDDGGDPADPPGTPGRPGNPWRPRPGRPGRPVPVGGGNRPIDLDRVRGFGPGQPGFGPSPVDLDKTRGLGPALPRPPGAPDPLGPGRDPQPPRRPLPPGFGPQPPTTTDGPSPLDAPAPTTPGPFGVGRSPEAFGGFDEPPAADPCQGHPAALSRSLAFPELLLRAASLLADLDTRFLNGALTGAAYKSWATSPVAGRLVSFAAQIQGEFLRLDTVGPKVPCPAISPAGGVAVLPPGVDITDLIAGLPPKTTGGGVGETTVCFTPGTSTTYGTPTESGLVRDGYKVSETADQRYVVECLDGEGVATEEALAIDCPNESLTAFAQLLVVGGEVLHSPWFVAWS